MKTIHIGMQRTVYGNSGDISFSGTTIDRRSIISAMQARKQGKDFVHIGNVIGDVLEQFRLESDGELTRVWHIWDEVVGETLAANAQPAAFKGDLLLVHTTSSAWIHELQFLKADIISKINAALGKPMVREIKFKIGPFA